MSLRDLIMAAGSSASEPGWVARTSGSYGYNLGPAMDSTGNKIVSCLYMSGGQISRSTDYGLTWSVLSAPAASWHSVASSADGTKLIAVPEDDGTGNSNGYIHTSSNSGSTWTARTGPGKRAWYGCACSSDGTKMLVAAAGTGPSFSNTYPYTSTDSGASWTARTSMGVGFWESAAISDDGQIMLVCKLGGGMYRSTNGGASWAATGPARAFRAVAMSIDGTKMIAGADGGAGAYYSTNSGSSWTQVPGSSGGSLGVDISNDGTVMYAGSTSIGVLKSINSGAAWSLIPGRTSVWSVQCSADGSKAVCTSPSGDYPFVLI